jgi:hypothetical protein
MVIRMIPVDHEFLIMPVFFLSGLCFRWMEYLVARILTGVNPLTYGVDDAIRSAGRIDSLRSEPCNSNWFLGCIDSGRGLAVPEDACVRAPAGLNRCRRNVAGNH